MTIQPDVPAAIGNTPLVEIPGSDERGAIWVKMEGGNPTGSYKDRMALSMVEGAERAGDAPLAAKATVNARNSHV